MNTLPTIDRFRAVVTRLADGTPTQRPVRLAVDYRRQRTQPVFLRSMDEHGTMHRPDEFDQVQLLEAYLEHLWEEHS